MHEVGVGVTNPLWANEDGDQASETLRRTRDEPADEEDQRKHLSKECFEAILHVDAQRLGWLNLKERLGRQIRRTQGLAYGMAQWKIRAQEVEEKRKRRSHTARSSRPSEPSDKPVKRNCNTDEKKTETPHKRQGAS